MSEKDGGAAFPGAVPEYIDHPVHGRIHRAHVGMEAAPGMTLRDWFAGQALAGLLANADIARTANEQHPDGRDRAITQLQFARSAYSYADAMLTERSKP